MWKDPIVEEIHKARERINENCKNEGISLYEHFLNVQKNSKLKTITSEEFLKQKKAS